LLHILEMNNRLGVNTMTETNRTASFILAISLISTVFLSLAGAQESKTRPYVRYENMTSSERRVSLKLTFSDGNHAFLHEHEGGTILIEKDGTTFGLTPRVKEESKGSVILNIARFSLFNPTEIENSEQIELDMTSNASSTLLPNFSIQVQGIEKTTWIKPVSKAEECGCSLRYENLRICADCIEIGNITCKGAGCPAKK
jgi:hypothetical protein